MTTSTSTTGAKARTTKQIQRDIDRLQVRQTRIDAEVNTRKTELAGLKDQLKALREELATIKGTGKPRSSGGPN